MSRDVPWHKSYQGELVAKDKKIVELTNSNITKDGIIKAFSSFDSLTERLFLKNIMQLMFCGNSAWDDAYKEMKKAGYFKETQPQIILNNPRFSSLYEIKGNKEVIIGK